MFSVFPLSWRHTVAKNSKKLSTSYKTFAEFTANYLYVNSPYIHTRNIKRTHNNFQPDLIIISSQISSYERVKPDINTTISNNNKNKNKTLSIQFKRENHWKNEISNSALISSWFLQFLPISSISLESYWFFLDFSWFLWFL